MSPTMQALVVVEPGRLEIHEVPVPVPGPNEVLARVRAVSICGTDAHLIRGDYPGFWPPAFPFTPGHEWAGEIVDLGPGVELYGWKVGDRVAGTSHDACGVCQKCVEGRYNLCETTGGRASTSSTDTTCRAPTPPTWCRGEDIFPLPDGLSFDEGAVIDPASIGLHVANRGNIAPGDTVAITGAGAIGLLGGDAARIRGAARVILIERHDGRLAKAAAMGFETVDAGPETRWPPCARCTGGFGVDVVLECAGVPVTVEWAVGMLRRGGRCAAVGIPTVGVEIAMQRLVLDELELVGSRRRASAGEMRRVMPLVEQGRMRVREVMTTASP